MSMTKEQVERIIGNSVADLAFEGLTATDANVAAMRRIVTGETTLESELDALDEKYDRQAYEKAMADYRANPKTYSLDEVESELADEAEAGDGEPPKGRRINPEFIGNT